MRNLVLVSSLALMLAGCDGSSSSGETGLVTIAAMDAPGDVTCFAVRVQSIRMVRQTGAATEVLRVPRNLDFAALRDSAEMLVTTEVPAGTYAALDLTLDFRDTVVRLADGTSVQLYDEDGQTQLTHQLQLTIQLASAISIGPGEPAHLIFDLDLDESLEAMTVLNRYRFRPHIEVRNQEQEQVETRFNGTLESVDETPGDPSFTVELDPPVTTRNRVSLMICEETSFNGVNEGGTAAGVTAMLRNSLDERVMVTARFNAQEGRFEAHEILLGPGGPGGWTSDVAMGYVAAFDGDAYEIIGAQLVRPGGEEDFGVNLVARIDNLTTILKKGETVDVAELGIGQHVMVSGTLVTAPTPEMQCDSVRLLETTIGGDVVATSAAEPQLVLDLQRFGQHPIDLFDLSGHGVDPASYRVLTTLDLSEYGTGDPVECRGFVLGNSLAADFESFEVAGTASTTAVLSVTWALPGTAAPLNSAVAFPCTLNLAGTEVAEVLLSKGTIVVPLTGVPQLELPPGGASGPFAVRQGGDLTLYDGSDAALWLQDLNSRLADGMVAVRLTGKGEFTDGTPQVFVANELTIAVRNP